MEPVKEYYKNIATKLIEHLEKRRFEAYYCATKEEAQKKVLELIPEGSVVSNGGSITIEELGILDKIKSGNYTYIDRHKGETPEEQRESMIKSNLCDYYLMSSNAITSKGELINIDGYGNRVAALTFGPKNVIVVIGMNKLCKDVEEGIWRSQNIASPKNTLRLNKNTPCAKTGVCGNCYGEDSICSTITITRRIKDKGRVKIILVGENLGY